MGATERRQREREEMRERILEAAAGMFAEHGYEGVSLRKIAQKIEYSPGAIYLYFKDKNQLLFAVQERSFTRFHAAMARNNRIADPLKRLHRCGETYLQFALDHPEDYDLMFIVREPMHSLRQTEEWNEGRRAFQQLRDNIQACIDAEAIRMDDADLGALMIWSFMHGLSSLAIRERMKMYPERGRRALMKRAIAELTRIIAA